jgi:hypothetical protein
MRESVGVTGPEAMAYEALVRRGLATRLPGGGQWVPQPGIAFRPGAPDECTLSDLARDHDR